MEPTYYKVTATYPLNVYSSMDGKSKNVITTIKTGTCVLVDDLIVSNSIQWAEISVPTIGYAIYKHPSVVIPYMEKASNEDLLAMGFVVDTSNNSTEEYSDSKPPVISALETVGNMAVSGVTSVLDAAGDVVEKVSLWFRGDDYIVPDAFKPDTTSNSDYLAGLQDKFDALNTTDTIVGGAGTNIRETTGKVYTVDDSANVLKWNSTGEKVNDPYIANTLKTENVDERYHGIAFEDSTNPPLMVQNLKGFPRYAGFDTSKKIFNYDYYIDYSEEALVDSLKNLRKNINFSLDNPDEIFNRNARMYNRFKLPELNSAMTKVFPHIFFTRPDCNIISYVGSNLLNIENNVKNDSKFALEFKNNKYLLAQLSANTGEGHDFMMLLSNKATSFECKDRSLDNDTYGKNKYGYSISYGKNHFKSETAGEVSISYTDDASLHILKLHQLWVDYISGVYSGRLTPKDIHMMNKELDYACSIYYIVCGANGEDIIYYSKLYGVFPTVIPDSTMSWQKGEVVHDGNINITYAYSIEKYLDPTIITEFNMCSQEKFVYEQTYNKFSLSTGRTWVGSPFIEVIENDNKKKYKLRFRPSNI